MMHHQDVRALQRGMAHRVLQQSTRPAHAPASINQTRSASAVCMVVLDGRKYAGGALDQRALGRL